MRQTTRNEGFTLVEIMIVVMIIGLLAAIAIPSFAKARFNARVSAQINDLRILEDAFQMYAMENKGFPQAIVCVGILPPGMQNYVKGNTWSETTPSGGRYWWKTSAIPLYSNTFCIAIVSAPDTTIMDAVDDKIDDGFVTLGKLRRTGPNYYLILDQ